MREKEHNPAETPEAALLRFLDTVPSGGRRSPEPRPEPESPEPELVRAAEGVRLRCPAPGDYMRVALGAAEHAEATLLLDHAAACGVCANVLAVSLRALEGNPSAEEAAAITELAAARTQWQADLTAKMAATPALKRPLPFVPRLRRGGSSRRWLAVGAAAVLAAAAAGALLWQRHASDPATLLASAYQQSRTLELRIPEAGYAALTASAHTRGAAVDDEPAPLLEARAGLARRLQESPQDGHWLELQARADVLEERYDTAIDALDRLLAEGPQTAELLTDAAAAYYQRGLVTNRELDRSTALDYLRRADEIAPTDPVVLFNEAVVMQDRGQMMNAVEVWNRYLSVEHNARWAAEGKRKLAELETALKRLKSHESRLRQMLATPEAMDALAGDPGKLAAWDEELSTLQLKTLTGLAYPEPSDTEESDAAGSGPVGAGPAGSARGSPCTAICQAARRLLQATGRSLEIQHHDFWLSDLLSVEVDALPETTRTRYMQAMRLLGQAAHEIQSGLPETGKGFAAEARLLFADLKEHARPKRADRERGGDGGQLRRAFLAGEDRSDVEYLFALQRLIDFRGCRAFARRLHAQPEFETANARYPWIAGMELITEKVCDYAPETRAAGRRLEAPALRIAQSARYPLLEARVRLRIADDAQDAGDDEAYEGQALAVFNTLVASDSSPVRIAYTIGGIPYSEEDSPRRHMAELSYREAVAWAETAEDAKLAPQFRSTLATMEIRIGAMAEAEKQLAIARSEARGKDGKALPVDYSESDIAFAQAMLERGAISEAAAALDRAGVEIDGTSDMWMLRRYNEARGQLLLSRGDYKEAEKYLAAEIRASEGARAEADRSTEAEYGQQDHDLYGELAAVWLAQGRPAASVLALWERFRLRSRGLAIEPCPDSGLERRLDHGLDCQTSDVLREEQRLGDSVLTGQIVLLDRVLVYRADRHAVTWSVKPARRQDVEDAAQTLERAVSSAATPRSKTERLGQPLREMLLPELPRQLAPPSELLLEPDPLLQNLSWPVLPTASGPLGLQYGLAEVTSLLAPQAELHAARAGEKLQPLVVGASITGEGEPPLPEALIEARAVDGLLHAPLLLLGQQATTARLAKALGTASVFHFAGHAINSGEGTELLLASSAGEARPWVDGAFLRQHPPRACRLAVLSACATGEHDASWKHPLQDIVEALNSSGVPEVVATRWQVDSQASVPFMESFYQNLYDGRSVAWALTAARRVQFDHPSYGNPYYWGAYYLSARELSHARGVLDASFKEEVQ